MSLANPLPATWQAVLVVTESYKITRRVLERTPSHPHVECQQALQHFQRKLRVDTLFEEKDSLQLLQTTNGKSSQEREEIEGLLVLGLWASFERFLRDFLQEKGTVLKQYLQPQGFANSLYQHFSKNIERWEPRDILDFPKDSLFNTPDLQLLIEEAQQILTYRNWVAHANSRRTSQRRRLEVTYQTLNEIVEVLLQY